MAGDKGHKKKTKGRKAVKRKAAVTKKADQASDGAAKSSAAPRNPKAFVFSSRGRAKQQRARTAERDQRRLHGRVSSALHTCSLQLRGTLRTVICALMRAYAPAAFQQIVLEEK